MSGETGGTPLNHLSLLIDQGANVCTTHALFKMLNREIYEKLKGQNYTLICRILDLM